VHERLRKKIGPFDCCTVILGKCEKYLTRIPKGSIDLIVTDPPYGMNLESWREHGPILGDDHFPVETIKRLIKIPRLASYFFCRWNNLWEHETLPKPKSVVVWEKIETGGTGDTKHEHSRDPRLGDITEPCGVPSFVSYHWPCSITPAFSHFWIRRTIRLSLIRCSTNWIIQL
jgi:hypothetical protein